MHVFLRVRLETPGKATAWWLLRATEMLERVLVVDDDESSRTALEVLLMGEGFSVVAAASAEQALATIASTRLAAVVTDLSLPGMSGLELLARTREQHPEAIVIVMTGGGHKAVAIDAIRAGAEAYLEKPVVADELLVILQRALERRRIHTARLLTFVEHGTNGVALLTADGSILKANAKLGELFGYSPDEPPNGKQLFEQVIAADWLQTDAALARALERPLASVRVSFRVATPAGPIRWVEGSISNLLSDPTVRALVANFQDATEAHDTDARYRRLIETMNQGVWTVDAHGLTTFVNAHTAAMLGVSREDLIGRSPLDFIGETDGAQFVAGLQAHFPGPRPAREVQFTRGDGTTFWGLVSASATLDAAGRFDGAFAVITDITQRKNAEEAQRASEERYRALFENSPLPKWLYDVETLRILAVNDATLRAYGYSRDELLQMTILDLRPREDAARATAAAHATREPGTADFGVWRQRRKDGRVFKAAITAHTFVMDGKLARLAVAQDIDEQQRLEEQLRQAQKMEAVGRLAGGVAHDFNNVLTVILSCCELARADLRADSPLRADIDEIHAAGLRASDLTRQLLMFSRQQITSPKVVDPNEIISGMTKMLRRIVGEDVEVSMRPGSSGAVCIDPGSFEQVIMNLVVNARDAMPRGGRLTIETTDDAVGHVHVAVTDTGVGMDETTKARIFEPFFTTKAPGKGTGLGLSTVFGIVKKSGGAIDVCSTLGAGTTFDIVLPRVEVDSAAVLAPQGETPLRGSETILLIDDEDRVRAVARTVLARSGYSIIEAGTPAEALALFEQHKGAIDLVVTDVVMPKMSGPTLAQRMREMRPDVKVLCMSGYANDDVAGHGALDGFAFIQKPLTPRALTTKVREVLDVAR